MGALEVGAGRTLELRARRLKQRVGFLGPRKSGSWGRLTERLMVKNMNSAGLDSHSATYSLCAPGQVSEPLCASVLSSVNWER